MGHSPKGSKEWDTTARLSAHKGGRAGGFWGIPSAESTALLQKRRSSLAPSLADW